MSELIRTTTGDIPIEDIQGHVLIHEHINVDTSHIKKDPDARLMEPRTVVDELKKFEESGGQAIVDVTSKDTGRSTDIISFVNSKTNLSLICSTGYYFGLYLSFDAINRSVFELTQHFVNEIERGINGSGIKAGVIGEIGTSLNVLPSEKRIFEAAVNAQKETGVPIITHSQFGWNALEQLNLLLSLGANPEKIAIGHMDLYPDMKIHLEVAKSGAYVCIDNIGRNDYRPDDERVRNVEYLFERGLGHRVLLSSDTSRKSHLHRYGGHGYDHVSTVFVNKLKDEGFNEQEINLLYRENPLRLLKIERNRGE